MRTYRVLGALTVLSVLLSAGVASAQSFNADARTVAMGGSGSDNTNIAMSMVPKGQPYKVIVLPFGLIQVLQDIDKFNPTNAKFDPVVMIEDLSNPIHFTFNRHDTGTTNASATLINDLRNGNINSNLATYVGFKMPTTLSAQGLVDPSIGGTIKFVKRKSGGFQGLYLGAGPYMGFADTLNTDQSLVNIFATGVVPANATPSIHNNSLFQIAIDYVIGWRGRVPLKAGADKDTRDGVYFAYNYRIIKGFRLLQDDMTVRFDLDSTARINFSPTTVPFTVTDVEATKGTGRAQDIGFEVVKGMFSFGFGLNGMGNKIDWTNFTTKQITLNSLSNAAQTNQTTTTTTVTNTTNALTIKLPVVKTGNLSFEKMGWGFMGVYTQGYNGKAFHGGVERKIGPMWVRGGGKYTRGNWDPTYGFGFGTKKAIDVGFFGTHGNLANERKTAVAVSFRFMPGEKKPNVKK